MPTENRRINEKDILKKSVDTGGSLQLIIAMEECAELIQAVSKVIRNGEEKLDNLAEEISHVEILCDQLKVMFDIESKVEESKEEAYLRIQKRLTRKVE